MDLSITKEKTFHELNSKNITVYREQRAEKFTQIKRGKETALNFTHENPKLCQLPGPTCCDTTPEVSHPAVGLPILHHSSSKYQ